MKFSPDDSPKQRAETLARLKAEVLARAEAVAALIQGVDGIAKAVLDIAALDRVINQPVNVKKYSLDGRPVYQADLENLPAVIGSAIRVLDAKAAEDFVAAVARLRGTVR